MSGKPLNRPFQNTEPAWALHPDPDTHAAEFLAHVQALSAEVRLAIDAIAANDLPALTESILRQEDICSELAVLPRPAITLGQGDPDWALAWTEVESRIGTAIDSLRNVSLEYALVLDSSSRSLSLLSALRRGCAGEVGTQSFANSTTSVMAPGHTTWRCEA